MLGLIVTEVLAGMAETPLQTSATAPARLNLGTAGPTAGSVLTPIGEPGAPALAAAKHKRHRRRKSQTTAKLLAAGDIASCSSSGDEATAKLLDTLAGRVITLGDNAYDSGTASEFNNCYKPTWGRQKARTRPAAGNHDYETAGAAGYFGYFGAAAGDPKKGYYSYDLGAWHIVALNSQCGPAHERAEGTDCAAGSTQEQWLRADLAAHPTACTLAFFHHPRFASGIAGRDDVVLPLWQALHDGGVDVILNGHDHSYERFAPQDPSGAPDADRGIREFVVGTGGHSHQRSLHPEPSSELRDARDFGVLRLTLHPTAYDWAFVTDGGAAVDLGSGPCH